MAEIREHCWHVDPLVLLTYPAIYSRKCCHCGVTVSGRRPLIYPTGHGPYVIAQAAEGAGGVGRRHRVRGEGGAR